MKRLLSFSVIVLILGLVDFSIQGQTTSMNRVSEAYYRWIPADGAPFHQHNYRRIKLEGMDSESPLRSGSSADAENYISSLAQNPSHPVYVQAYVSCSEEDMNYTTVWYISASGPSWVPNSPDFPNPDSDSGIAKGAFSESANVSGITNPTFPSLTIASSFASSGATGRHRSSEETDSTSSMTNSLTTTYYEYYD